MITKTCPACNKEQLWNEKCPDFCTFDITNIPTAFFDSSKLPMDIICNGFSIRDTILNVLDKYNNGYRMDLPDDELNNLAQELTDALAIKCNLKQGQI